MKNIILYIVFGLLIALAYFVGLNHGRDGEQRTAFSDDLRSEIFMKGYDFGRSSEQAVMSNWYLNLMDDGHKDMAMLQILKLSLVGIENLYDGEGQTKLSVYAGEMGFMESSTKDLYQRNVPQIKSFIGELEVKLKDKKSTE